ncbi:hypothetical protein G4B88_005340 [Cannabis sativa]|uniref:RNase H type-1 domain-containing protein n=1 Tax=Cannabis sativa TaxID=3483 RepID=A0A7J6HBT2_CANSA|nr:hypothetical protein G4B88_005340 [Cannabis sativa]
MGIEPALPPTHTHSYIRSNKLTLVGSITRRVGNEERIMTFSKNDTFIFCEANKENVLEVKRCLEMYCRNSGQCVNSHKSAVVFSDNVDMGIRGEIKGLLGFRDLNREDNAPNSNLWSYGARSIMATRDFIRDESCFAIGNGELVDIWHSPWLPGYGWERYVASFNPRICEKGVRVSSLLIPGSGEWNREALESWFFPSMVRDALEVPRLSMTAKDELFWEAAPDEDSASHLFFHCDVAVQVWRSGPWGFCSDSMVFGDNLELVKWLLHPTGTPLGENDLVRFTIYVISLCFVLWRVRNSSFHEGLSPMVSKIQQEISSLVADYSLDRPSSLEMQGSIPAVAEANWRGLWTDVNVFVDAAIREEFGIVAILVLDRSGTVIEAVTAKRKVPTPFVAELEAFYSGCCRILQSGWENATIFSDCQTLVKSLAAGPSPEWRACGLFEATRNLLARLSHCQYRWIPRCLNSGAHCLAAWAADHSSFKFFTSREVAPFVATMNHGC